MYDGTFASSMAGIEHTIVYGPYSGAPTAGPKTSVCSPSPLDDFVSDQPPAAPVRSLA